MNQLRRCASTAPLATFFALTYSWSWLWWIPTVLTYRGSVWGRPIGALIIPIIAGAYGPTISAIAVTALGEGGPGLRALLRKYLDWRVNWRWYLAALATPGLAALVAIWWFTRRGGSVRTFEAAGLLQIPAALIGALPFGPLAEELGWRGFALPRLVRRHSLIAATLILGTAWTLWHAPLYWAPAGTSISGQYPSVLDVATYLFEVVGMAFLFTWIGRHTRWNVPMALLLHAALNGSFAFLLFSAFSSAEGGVLSRQMIAWSAVPIWILVLAIIGIEGRAWIRRDPDQ
ncbi:MAG: CPBP family intramembrane glutamic endopeptidase [Gemmatimonadota bacterium]